MTNSLRLLKWGKPTLKQSIPKVPVPLTSANNAAPSHMVCLLLDYDQDTPLHRAPIDDSTKVRLGYSLSSLAEHSL